MTCCPHVIMEETEAQRAQGTLLVNGRVGAGFAALTMPSSVTKNGGPSGPQRTSSLHLILKLGPEAQRGDATGLKLHSEV